MTETKTKEEKLDTRLTYTAVDLAKELGTSDRNLNQSWYPKLCEIYWWKKDELKKGEKYTAWAREEFFKLQAAISPKLPMRNEDEMIIRDENGSPLIENNPDRIGIKKYKQLVWEKYNRFPPARVDAPTQEQVVEAEVCDVESITLYEGGLSTLDDFESDFDNIFDLVRTEAKANGNYIVGLYADELSKTVKEGVSGVHQKMGKAMSSRSRRKS